MYAQLSDNWRLIGRSLYRLQDGDYMHVAIVPLHVRGLDMAVTWFNAQEDRDDA